METAKLTASVQGEPKVQRDMEVVRSLLRAIQDKADLDARMMHLEGVNDLIVGHHLEMLVEAGYVDATISAEINASFPRVYVRDLTWEGHELAGALLTDEATWHRVSEAIGVDGIKKAPLKFIQDIATKALTAWAMKKLGL